MTAIHGYAIVSRDDCIADDQGQMPKVLMNDADWRYFQAELDRAALLVVTRVSHEATPNIRGRRRLIMSRQVSGLIERADGWWWNPQDLSWGGVVERLDLVESRIAVPGGQGAFDLFLTLGYTAFHLSRAETVTLPAGHKLFSGVTETRTADQILMAAGLTPGPVEMIDPDAAVSLTVYRSA
ncbi:MAG: hypothetical protein WCH83_02535 [Alphaproteobacteria bacterium]